VLVMASPESPATKAVKSAIARTGVLRHLP
jgi:hypothetical protein